jgi:type I restriction enzyme S subunit
MRAASEIWEPFQQEGTVFGAINRSDLSSASLPWPDSKSLSSLENALAVIDSRIESLSRETSQLINKRDTLLPELLSGRIRVSEVEEVTA